MRAMGFWTRLIFLFLALAPLCLAAFDDGGGDLMRDLMIVDGINRVANDRLPVTFNHFLQGGYLNMPSSRMAYEGDFGVGYSSVPPYRNINLRFQILPDLELTGSYRIFCDIPDVILAQYGFGNTSDRGLNVKFAILHPDDSGYTFPGVAVGLDDFRGTRSFESRYVVLTQVFPRCHLEMTLGYGRRRIRGLFGGLLWMPWRCSEVDFLRPLALVAEYDAIDYRNPKREQHPDGRSYRSRVNVGVKYRLWDAIDLSAAYIRGEEFAFSGSLFYNFGETEGFLPKIDNPLPYKAPLNLQAIGPLRSMDVFAEDLALALRRQGFEMLDAELLSDDCGCVTLRLVVYNAIYYWECSVREQLQCLLSRLIPYDIDCVIVEMYEQGCAVQEYRFYTEYLGQYRDGTICAYELGIVSPLREVSYKPCMVSEPLFSQRLDLFCPWISPKTEFLFGSSRGKFKYALGIALGTDGYLINDLYYRIQLGYLFMSSIPNDALCDVLNPSRLPNVHTDLLNYLRRGPITVDEAFLQRNWNLGCGLFGRISAGYFSQLYGGVGTELLYYPLDYCFAISVEGSYLRKRQVKGLGFTSRIRKLNGSTPTYIHFPLYQYFLDLYYTLHCANVDFKVSGGRFLAGDYGARFEASRSYASGLRVTVWYTSTNAHDIVNGKPYKDIGIGFTMPLDVFYTCSSRKEWGTAISAWLRDSCYRTFTGDGLYNMIRSARQ